MQANAPEKLLTPEEVSEILQLEKNTLAKRRVAGRPPRYVKIGRSTVRYDPADIRDLIESQKRTSTAQKQSTAAAART